MSAGDPRDPELEGLYGDLDRLEPPPRLDAAILARARGAGQLDARAAAPAANVVREPEPRKGVDARRSRALENGRREAQMPAPPADDDEPPSELWPMRGRPGPLMRWRVPIAVAATLAIAGSLVFLMQADDRTDGLLAPRESLPATTAPAQAPPSAAKGAVPGEDAARNAAGPVPSAPPSSRAAARSSDAAGPTSDAALAAQRPQVRERAAAAPGASSEDAKPGDGASVSPRLAQEAPRAPSAAAGSPEARAVAPAPWSEGAQKRQAPATSPKPVESADRSLPSAQRELPTTSTGTADELVERIRALRREGREEEARRLLRELGERYPAFELPRDLRDLR
jgi:hypothetical protein